MTRLLAFLLVLLAALPASAASRLDTLLARGEALTARGDATCAAPLEAAAFAAESSDDAYARALGALGLCREVQGRFGEAHRLVSRALEGAPAETTKEGKAARWTTLRAALRRLDDRVARVLVTFDGDLWIDGHPAVAVSGAVLAVDPGRHVFEARGKATVAKEVEARAGDLPAVDLRSPAPRSEPTKQAVSVPLSPHPAPPSFFVPGPSPRGVSVGLTYGAASLALVSGIVAGVLEAQRAALAARLAPGACVDPSRPGCAELRLAFEQRTGARNVALVAGGVAVVAAGVAVGLYFTADRASGTGMVSVGGLW